MKRDLIKETKRIRKNRFRKKIFLVGMPLLSVAAIGSVYSSVGLSFLAENTSLFDSTSTITVANPSLDNNYEYFPNNNAVKNWQTGDNNDWTSDDSNSSTSNGIFNSIFGTSLTAFKIRMNQYLNDNSLSKNGDLNGEASVNNLNYNSFTKPITYNTYNGGMEWDDFWTSYNSGNEYDISKWVITESDGTVLTDTNTFWELVENNSSTLNGTTINFNSDKNGQTIFNKALDNLSLITETGDSTLSITTSANVNTLAMGNQGQNKFELDLSGLGITNQELDELKYFDLTSIKVLDLSNNDLSFIPDNLFANNFQSNSTDSTTNATATKILSKYANNFGSNLQTLIIDNNTGFSSNDTIFETAIIDSGDVSGTFFGNGSLHEIDLQNDSLGDKFMYNLLNYSSAYFFLNLQTVDLSYNQIANETYLVNGSENAPPITEFLYLWSNYGIATYSSKSLYLNNNEITSIDISDLGIASVKNILGSGFATLDLANNKLDDFTFTTKLAYNSASLPIIKDLNISNNQLKSISDYQGFNENFLVASDVDTGTIPSNIANMNYAPSGSSIELEGQTCQETFETDAPSINSNLTISLDDLPSLLYQNGYYQTTTTDSSGNTTTSSTAFYNGIESTNNDSNGWVVYFQSSFGKRYIDITSLMYKAIYTALNDGSNLVSIAYSDIENLSGNSSIYSDLSTTGTLLIEKKNSSISYNYQATYKSDNYTEILFKTTGNGEIDLTKLAKESGSTVDESRLEYLESKKPSELTTRDLSLEDDDGTVASDDIKDNILSWILDFDGMKSEFAQTVEVGGSKQNYAKTDNSDAITVSIVPGYGAGYDDETGSIQLRIKVVGGIDENGDQETFTVISPIITGFKCDTTSIGFQDTLNIIDSLGFIGVNGNSKKTNMLNIINGFAQYKNDFEPSTDSDADTTNSSKLTNFVNNFLDTVLDEDTTTAFDTNTVTWNIDSSGNKENFITLSSDMNTSNFEDATDSSSLQFTDQDYVTVSFLFEPKINSDWYQKEGSDWETAFKNLDWNGGSVSLVTQPSDEYPYGQWSYTYEINLNDLNNATNLIFYTSSEQSTVKNNISNDTSVSDYLNYEPSQLSQTAVNNLLKYMISPSSTNVVESGIMVSFNPNDSSYADDMTGSIKINYTNQKDWDNSNYAYTTTSGSAGPYMIFKKQSTLITWNSYSVIISNLNKITNATSGSSVILNESDSVTVDDDLKSLASTIYNNIIKNKADIDSSFIEELNTDLAGGTSNSDDKALWYVFLDVGNSERFDLDSVDFSSTLISYNGSNGTITLSFTYNKFFDENSGSLDSYTSYSFTSNPLSIAADSGNDYTTPTDDNSNITSPMLYLNNSLFANKINYNKQTVSDLKNLIISNINYVIRIPDVNVNDTSFWSDFISQNGGKDKLYSELSITDTTTGSVLNDADQIPLDDDLKISFSGLVDMGDSGSSYNGVTLESSSFNSGTVLYKSLSDGSVAAISVTLVLFLILIIASITYMLVVRKKELLQTEERKRWFEKMFKIKVGNKTTGEQLLDKLDKNSELYRLVEGANEFVKTDLVEIENIGNKQDNNQITPKKTGKENK